MNDGAHCSLEEAVEAAIHRLGIDSIINARKYIIRALGSGTLVGLIRRKLRPSDAFCGRYTWKHVKPEEWSALNINWGSREPTGYCQVRDIRIARSGLDNLTAESREPPAAARLMVGELQLPGEATQCAPPRTSTTRTKSRRGPRPETLNQTVSRIKDDLDAKKFSVEELRDLKQVSGALEYGVSQGTFTKARDSVLSQLPLLNSDK